MTITGLVGGSLVGVALAIACCALGTNFHPHPRRRLR